ncbi:Flp family type IVb pilin [Dinoroseobacter sp. S76]|uniref:Flp family type IVb pilin n=1 Tax=Dinoroseobacter sp. S76 TaxID=3415124 RepID=UPI003C7A1CD3
MKLFKLAHRFRTEEDGAVTVDWVVLTAAIVGLGIAVYGVVSGGISNLSGDIDTQLETDQINTSFPAAAPVD